MNILEDYIYTVYIYIKNICLDGQQYGISTED